MSEKQGHQLADTSVLVGHISMNRDSQMFAHGSTDTLTASQAESLSVASSRLSNYKTQKYGAHVTASVV
jgi:hypothetical protein